MIGGVSGGTVGATLLVALVTVVARRWSLGAALAVLIATQIASNSSLVSVKQVALTARWGSLFAVAVLLLPEFRNVRPLLKRLSPLAALPLFALLSASWSVDPRLSVERATSFGLLLCVVVGAAVRWHYDSRELGRFVDSVATLAGLTVVASAAVFIFTDRGALNGTLRGVFENPNGLGLFLGLTYPFAASALERRRSSILQIPTVAVFAAVDALSQSRSGLVTLLVTAIGYELARRRLGRLVLYAVTALCAFGIVVVGAGPFSSNSTPTKSGGVISAPAPHIVDGRAPVAPQTFAARLTGARTEAWSVTLDLISSRPTLGYGFGTGDRLFQRYPERVRFHYFVGNNPNEAYLQLALEFGVVGALLFVAPLLLAATIGVGVLRNGKSVGQVACALTLVGSMLAGLVESVFTSAGAPWALLMWLSAAACLTAPTAVPEADLSIGEGTVSWWFGLAGRPSARAIRVTASVCGVGLAALSVYFFLRPPSPSKPTLEAVVRRLAQSSQCGVRPCVVSKVEQIQPGYWWIVLSRTEKTCFVVSLGAVTVRSGVLPANLDGVVQASCAHQPLKQQHVLSVATLPTAPPYFIPPGEAPTGFEPALVRAIAQSLGIGLIRWGSAEPGSALGSADVVMHELRQAWSLAPTFVPYLPIRNELIAHRGTTAASVRTINEASQLLMAVSKDGAASVRHLLHPRTRPFVFASESEAVKAVTSGRVDAAVVGQVDAAAYVASDHRLVHVGLLPPDRYYGLRFASAGKLESLFKQELRRLRRAGKLAHLIHESLGDVPAQRSLR